MFLILYSNKSLSKHITRMVLLSFTSYFFLLIFIGSLIIYWSLQNYTKIQNFFLLSLSYFLLGFTDYWLVIIIFISTLSNFITGYLISKEFSKRIKNSILFIAIIFNVSLLFFLNTLIFSSNQYTLY